MSNPHGRKSYDDLASEPKKQAERRDLKNRIEQPLRDVHASVTDLIPDGCLPRLLDNPRNEDPNMLNWPFETLKLLAEVAEDVKNKVLTVEDVKIRLSQAMEQSPRDEYIKPTHFKWLSGPRISKFNRERANNRDEHQEEDASTDHSRNHSRGGRRRRYYFPANRYSFSDDDEEIKNDTTTPAAFPLRKKPRGKPDNATTASTSTSKTTSHKRSAPSQGSSSGDDLMHELALEKQKLKVMEMEHKLRKKQRQQSDG